MNTFLVQLIARCRTKASELHALPSTHANILALRAEARGLDDLAGLFTRLVGVEDSQVETPTTRVAPILPYRIVQPVGTPTVDRLQAEVKILTELADHRLGAISELEELTGKAWVPLADRVNELVVADVQAGNPPQTAA